MRIYSKPTYLETAPSDTSITILGTISEGRMFRIYKAQKGTKYIILKTPIADDSMLLEILRREYELSCNLNHPALSTPWSSTPAPPWGRPLSWNISTA